MTTTVQKLFASKKSVYYYAQKSLRIVWARRLLGWLVAALVPARPLAALQAQAAENLRELRQDGVTFTPWASLTSAQIGSALDFLSSKPLFAAGDTDKRQHPVLITQAKASSFRKLHYTSEDVAQCKELVSLANHPQLLAMAADYLGATPTISAMQTWWTMGHASNATDLARDDMFHRDVDDLRFVKMFIYLTDVDSQNGVHSFVPTSHRSTELVKRAPITDEQVRRYFGNDGEKTFTGPAGTIFLEDTWGIHRQMPAVSGRRCIFSVIYTVSGLDPNSPPRPVASLPTGLDAYVNRIYYTPT